MATFFGARVICDPNHQADDKGRSRLEFTPGGGDVLLV